MMPYLHRRLIILAGTDAISGGIFEDSPAIDRKFLEQNHIDLYIPGNPVHPLTFINGIMDLLGIKPESLYFRAIYTP